MPRSLVWILEVGLAFVPIIYFARVWRGRKTRDVQTRLDSKESDATDEAPIEASLPEENWVDVAAFPMDHRSIQPLGSQVVTKKTFREFMGDYLNLLKEADIPFRVVDEPDSLFGAEKVQVPEEHREKSIEILEKLNPRDTFV